ncbi:MAG: crossover junction endodeoxyribonuclease RuvC [Pseudomonadota bacterium]
MNRVLGIDPGSRVTGFGVVDFAPNQVRHVASGQLKLTGETLAERLSEIFEGLSAVVAEFQPGEVAVEQVFMHRNAASALKLGHARGVAILSATRDSLPVHEYSPTEVKLATTGRGRATKEQVQHMIKVLLSLDRLPATDTADALAVAVCHSHMASTRQRVHAAMVAAEADAKSAGSKR